MNILNHVYAELYSEKEISDWFENQAKCRYEVIIKSLEEDNIDECFSTLHIKTKNIILEQLGLSHSDCDVSDLSRGHPKKDLEVGNTIYGIANSETFKVIYGGKEYFDLYPKIPLCEGGVTPQFSQNIVVGAGILSIILLGIAFFWIKKSLRKSKHKK